MWKIYLMKIVEGLFVFVIIGAFILFAVAKKKKQTFSDAFNEMIDNIFGRTEELSLNPTMNTHGSGFKPSGLFKGMKAPPNLMLGRTKPIK